MNIFYSSPFHVTSPDDGCLKNNIWRITRRSKYTEAHGEIRGSHEVQGFWDGYLGYRYRDLKNQDEMQLTLYFPEATDEQRIIGQWCMW